MSVVTLTLHHIKNTRSLRPLWLMEELGIEYTLVNEGETILNLDKQAFRQKNPVGKMPAFFDGDQGIFESVAIIEYIANKYGGEHLVRKPGDDEYGAYLQYLHFGEAGMGGYMSLVLGHTFLLPEKHRNEKVAAWALGEMNNAISYLDEEIKGKDYFLGSFSLVDISIAYMLFLMKISRNSGEFGPNIKTYFDRIKKREAWIKATSLPL